MTNIAVVFHSGYGHTLRMAQAVAEGAGAPTGGHRRRRQPARRRLGHAERRRRDHHGLPDLHGHA